MPIGHIISSQQNRLVLSISPLAVLRASVTSTQSLILSLFRTLFCGTSQSVLLIPFLKKNIVPKKPVQNEQGKKNKRNLEFNSLRAFCRQRLRTAWMGIEDMQQIPEGKKRAKQRRMEPETSA